MAYRKSISWTPTFFIFSGGILIWICSLLSLYAIG